MDESTDTKCQESYVGDMLKDGVLVFKKKFSPKNILALINEVQKIKK